MNLCGSSKREVGVFLRVVIFLLRIRPPHTSHAVSLALCTHAVILHCLFCHAPAYAITSCLASFDSALCNNFIQKSGLIFEGGPIFRRLRYNKQTNKQTKQNNKQTKQQNIGTFSPCNIVQNNSAILLRECGHCPTAPFPLPPPLLLLLLEILNKELDLLDQSLSHSRRLWQTRSNTHTWNTKTRKR